MTPKQEIVAHLELHHGEHVHRGTHQQLVLRHRAAHRHHLTHTHRPNGWTTGSEQIEVTISLSPPKNPSASRNGDRNWVLHIAHLKEGHGWRYELPGTRAGDVDGATLAADNLLGWKPAWVPKGWGFEAHERGQ